MMLSRAAVGAPRAFPSARRITAHKARTVSRGFGARGDGLQGPVAFDNPSQPLPQSTTPQSIPAPSTPPPPPPPAPQTAPPAPSPTPPPSGESDSLSGQAMQMRQLQPQNGTQQGEQGGLEKRGRGDLQGDDEKGGDEDPGWGQRSYDLSFLRERKVPEHLEKSLPEAGQPSMISRDADHPEGTYPEAHMTPMQSHVAFFDTDGDGQIWPGDTYQGFRRLGFNRTISALGGVLIHGAFSYVTLPPGRWLPDPAFRVNINYIHKAKHGSDSETYDTEGRWVSQKFEEVFSKYGHTYPDALTWEELVSMTGGNKNAMDFFGWTAEKLEWGITFSLCARPVYEPDGPKVLRKDDARGVLDGTLFYRIAEDLEGGKLQRRGPKEAGFKKSSK